MLSLIILIFIVAIIYKVFFEIKKDTNFKSHLLEYYEKEENLKQKSYFKDRDIEIPEYNPESTGESKGYIPDYILQKRIERLTPEQTEQVFWSTKIEENYFVAGYQYNDGPKIKSKLKEGVNVELIRDFENKADNNAVKIMLGKYRLGFIPREYAIGISRKMDEENVNFGAWIHFFNNSERKPFYKLCIHVYEV